MNSNNRRTGVDPVFRNADELLTDLHGAGGEERRRLAAGYLRAVSDSDADFLDGRTLLQYLAGEAGELLRVEGKGYVMAVRDSAASHAAGAFSSIRSDDPSGRLDEERVAAYLERHASLADEPAFYLTRRALSEVEDRTDRPNPTPRWRLAPARSIVSAMALATLCAAAYLGGQRGARNEPALDPAHAQDIVLSQRAGEITRLLLEERRFEKDSFINLPNRDERSSYVRRWDVSRRDLAAAIEQTQKLELRDADRQAIRAIASDFRTYVVGYQRVLSDIDRGVIRTAEDANARIANYKGAVHRIEANGEAISARAAERLDRAT